MKSIIHLFVMLSCSYLSCGTPSTVEELAPINDFDSIGCAKNWQSFQLQQDTILLLLKYQEPYIIESGKDKLTITILDIVDDCSEESAKLTYGCDVEVSLKLQLNNKCEYVTKYPIRISRYSLRYWNFNSIKDLYCNYSNSSAMILNDNSIPHLLFYNTMVTLWQVAPFTNTEKELFEIARSKEKYSVRIYLQKRCY